MPAATPAARAWRPSRLLLAPVLLLQLAPLASSALVLPAHAARPAPRHAPPAMSIFDSSDSLDRSLRSVLTAHAGKHKARFGPPGEMLSKLESVHVLLFNPDQQDEGVYTLQGKSDRRSYILCFEEADEAEAFARLLEAESFDMATPTSWSSQKVKSFCDATGFQLSLLPQGALFMPPARNVYVDNAFDDLHESLMAAQRAGADVPASGAVQTLMDDLHDHAVVVAKQMLEHMWNLPGP